MMQCIIRDEIRRNHFLWYDETLNEEKKLFMKTKVCEFFTYRRRFLFQDYLDFRSLHFFFLFFLVEEMKLF
jgi:hypothetical protein